MDHIPADEALIKIAEKGQLQAAGQLIVQTPDGRRLALYLVDGQIYALNNACPHMGGPLGEGQVEDGIITCPWHGWQFEIATGCCINMPGDDVEKIEVIEKNNDLFIRSCTTPSSV